MDKVFKVFNVLVIVFAGLTLLISGGAPLFAALATSGTDQITQGGVTFFMMLALLPSAILAVMAVLAGRAGLQGDPYTCRKYAKILLGVEVLNVVTNLTGGFSAGMIIGLAFYGFYCYLAHTASY